jgi:predicted 3-demethylubiquinone-9 3-methyltransferase (glyoxalase superfamily)
MGKITPCLWFDTQGEEAAIFYTSIFKDSRITQVTHYGHGWASRRVREMARAPG